MSKILLVEDDESVIEVVNDVLAMSRFIVETAVTGDDGLHRISHFEYDLVILDWLLPGASGVEICTRYRASGGRMPILMLSGNADVQSRVAGLTAGADDYLTKPFAMQELTARLSALLRRPEVKESDVLQLRGFSLDTGTKRLSAGDCQVTLLPQECRVLEFLMRNPNRYFTSAELLKRAWQTDSESTQQAVRQTVLRLRSKMRSTMPMEVAASVGDLIVHSVGEGYKLA